MLNDDAEKSTSAGTHDCTAVAVAVHVDDTGAAAPKSPVVNDSVQERVLSVPILPSDEFDELQGKSKAKAVQPVQEANVYKTAVGSCLNESDNVAGVKFGAHEVCTVVKGNTRDDHDVLKVAKEFATALPSISFWSNTSTATTSVTASLESIDFAKDLDLETSVILGLRKRSENGTRLLESTDITNDDVFVLEILRSDIYRLGNNVAAEAGNSNFIEDRMNKYCPSNAKDIYSKDDCVKEDFELGECPGLNRKFLKIFHFKFLNILSQIFYQVPRINFHIF